MKPNSTNNATNFNKQLALREWMASAEGRTFKRFGEVMGGITGEGAKKLLRGPRMPVKRYQQLVAAFPDIPLEFLPEPRDVLSGPKPKFEQSIV